MSQALQFQRSLNFYLLFSPFNASRRYIVLASFTLYKHMGLEINACVAVLKKTMRRVCKFIQIFKAENHEILVSTVS